MAFVPAKITFAGHSISFERPLIMGILNVTPDSFSDGGRHNTLASARAVAEKMLAAGADIIDVGGESTRPGAPTVTESEELDRTVQLVELLVASGAVVSVDTSKAVVMRECLRAGAFMINDVRALREPGALEAVAATGAPVCLMHMQGEPRTMQENPHYDHVVEDVIGFLAARIASCRAAGLDVSKIIVDPGFGFGKNAEHNLCLLKGLAALQKLDCPVLAGLSRKSVFADILDLPVDQRLHASVAAALLAVERGAHIVRVHDVTATAHALGVYNAMCSV